MGIIYAKVRPAEIYVDAKVDGSSILCILDTECERSIIGRKFISNLELTDTGIKLFAANGTAIPLVGAVLLNFQVGGVPVNANVVVSETMYKLILGIDWLSTNNCQWNFGAATLTIGQHTIRVYRRPTRNFVRRVYDAED